MTRSLRTIVATTLASVASVTVLVVLGATPAYAASGTVSFANGTITYVAGPGLVNRVTVTTIFGWIGTPNTVVIDDTQAITVPVVRGGYCTHPTPDRTIVHCNPPGAVTMSIDVRDGNDYINYADGWTNAVLAGGSGNDQISTSAGANVKTQVFGGIGNDFIVSLPSDDAIDGGSGFDLIEYSTGNDVVASLITGAGGAAGETDVYSSIEGLGGGGGNDLLIGDDVANQIYGAYGDDQIYGNGGADWIYGDGGIYSSPGQDYIRGGSGNDTIHGDNGADMLFGDEGEDVLDGGHDEVLDGGPFSDYLNGGQEDDECGRKAADAVADVLVGCEVVYESWV